jgi:hypothetical protein
MKERISKIIIKQRGSKFLVKNSPIWNGFIGEILKIRNDRVDGEMPNGFVGTWRLSDIEIIEE